ncbi:hypothetical protein ACT3SP_06575 [Brachybacterium sp. AOP43-C2-M15]|uniref:hypothetical protein n=1 Tax=Brachybacterium sp. AOP43-C2-M15 TaxID=3457661 RepID=UPI00403378A7
MRHRPRRPYAWTDAVAAAIPIFVVSFLLALWLLSPFFHWRLRWDLLRFLIPSWTDPASGMPSLVIALFLVLWGSWVLLRIGTARATGTGSGHGSPDAPLRIPIGEITDLGPAEREQAARALGLEWDEGWAHDDAAWKRAHGTGMAEALRILREGRRP